MVDKLEREEHISKTARNQGYNQALDDCKQKAKENGYPSFIQMIEEMRK